MSKANIIKFAILLIFPYLTAMATAQATVDSVGEINAKGNNIGTVIAGTTAGLVLTLIANMSQAEPGEEIASIQITIPSGFTAKENAVESLKMGEVNVPDFQSVLDGNRITVSLPTLITLTAVVEIEFTLDVPPTPVPNGLFIVGLMNIFQTPILVSIKQGEADGMANNDGLTVKVVAAPESPSGGNVRPDSNNENDTEPPSIVHTPVIGLLQQEIEDVCITATVSDQSEIAEVTLYYRSRGAHKYSDVEMAKLPGGKYESEIPSSALIPAGVDYYISAIDIAGNMSALHVFTITVSETLKIPIDASKENEIVLGSGSSVYFPAGAIDVDSYINVTVPTVPKFNQGPQIGLGKRVITREFSSDAKLRKPIRLTLRYSDERLAGEEESMLALYRWDSQSWVYLSSVVPQENSATVATMELGIFSIMLTELEYLASLPAWDVNMDGVVNTADLVVVTEHFGEPAPVTSASRPDVNRDGIVNILDLIIVCRHLPAPKEPLEVLRTLSQDIGALDSSRIYSVGSCFSENYTTGRDPATSFGILAGLIPSHFDTIAEFLLNTIWKFDKLEVSFDSPRLELVGDSASVHALYCFCGETKPPEARRLEVIVETALDFRKEIGEWKIIHWEFVSDFLKFQQKPLR